MAATTTPMTSRRCWPRVPGVKAGRAVVFSVFDPVTGSEEAVAMVEADGSSAATQRR